MPVKYIKRKIINNKIIVKYIPRKGTVRARAQARSVGECVGTWILGLESIYKELDREKRDVLLERVEGWIQQVRNRERCRDE